VPSEGEPDRSDMSEEAEEIDDGEEGDDDDADVSPLVLRADNLVSCIVIPNELRLELRV
jgi:hypothetical protein